MFLNLNYPLNFPVLHPAEDLYLCCWPTAKLFPAPLSFCWFAQIVSRHVPLVPPLSACWLSSPLLPTLSKNIEVTAKKKLQNLCNLRLHSHRFCVVSSSSRCLAILCSGPRQYLPLFTSMVSTAWWGMDLILCLLHQFSSISTFKRHPAVSCSYHPVCSLTANIKGEKKV